MNGRLSLVLLVAILLFGGALRFGSLEQHGLAIDEAYSITLASYDPVLIVAGTAVDQHPPLYYLVLHAWMALTGRSLFSVRALSVLVGWATLPLVYVAARRLHPRAGLLAAGLLAVSPAHVWYSQVARMYALLALFGVVSTVCAWVWWTDARRRTWLWAAAYVAATLAAVYTQYFALFLVAGQNLAAVALLWVHRGPERRRIAAQWLGMQLVVVLGFLPWLPVMLDQALHHRMDWIAPLSWAQVRSSWGYLLYGRRWAGSWPDYVAAALGLLLVALSWPGRRTAGRAPESAWYGPAAWFWTPFVLILLAGWRRPLYQEKQLLILLPALVALVAGGLLRAPGRMWRAVLLVAVLALTAGPLIGLYTHPPQEHWHEVAAYLNARARPGDMLYVNASSGFLALDYYLQPDLTRAGYPADYSLLSGGWEGEVATPPVIERQMSGLLAGYSRLWLVEFIPGFWDPNGLIRAWLERNAQVVERVEFGGLRVWLFTRSTP